MKKDIKEEIVLCEICGYPVLHNEYGFYQDCPKCGWRCGADNRVLERQWGISYPMLVSLSHAKKQYQKRIPFKADFDEFIRGLFFYSEMLFDYQGTTFEVFLKGAEKSDIIVFCCMEFQQEYFSEKDFRQKANIDGTLLKDLWVKVQNPRYM